MIPMLSGVVELIMRSIAAIYLSVPFGYEGICMAEPIAWISCAVFVLQPTIILCVCWKEIYTC